MKLVLLQYSFLFDPAECWSSLGEFEGDLAKFFSRSALDAEFVKPVDGQNGVRILFIKRKNMMDMMASPQTEVKIKGRPKSPQGIIRDMSKRSPKATERDFGKKKLSTDKIFNKVKKK